MNNEYEDYESDDVYAGLEDWEITIAECVKESDKEVNDEDKLTVFSNLIMEAVKSKLINSSNWDEVKPLLTDVVSAFRGCVSDYLYLFSLRINAEKKIADLEDKLTGSAKEDSNTKKSISHNKMLLESSIKQVEFIIKSDLAFIKNDDVMIERVHHDRYGSYFSMCKDTGLFKSKPSIFGDKTLISLLRHNLEQMGRNKRETGISFAYLGADIYNMAMAQSQFLRPTHGSKHHEFFDILFTSVCPSPTVRRVLLDSIAWKWYRPEEFRLPSPVFSGAGGAGKSGIGMIMNTIVGSRNTIWAANITEDSIKNNSYLTGKWMVNFDDLLPIAKDSKEHQFIKKIVHNPSFECRDLYAKAKTIDTTAWCWFNGQSTNGEKCPIPLEGDGATGVDRRFLPILIKKNLVEVVKELKPELGEDEVLPYIDRCFNTICTDKNEVAKWLGNIIDASGVLTKAKDEYPRAVMEEDYLHLTGEKNQQIVDVFTEVFVSRNFDFIYTKELYNLYLAHCDDMAVAVQYRKTFKNFTKSINDLLEKEGKTANFTYGRFAASRALKKDYVTGWRREKILITGQKCISEQEPEWTTKMPNGKFVMNNGMSITDLSVPLIADSIDDSEDVVVSMQEKMKEISKKKR
jgi:hypothetical protein